MDLSHWHRLLHAGRGKGSGTVSARPVQAVVLNQRIFATPILQVTSLFSPYQSYWVYRSLVTEVFLLSFCKSLDPNRWLLSSPKARQIKFNSFTRTSCQQFAAISNLPFSVPNIPLGLLISGLHRSCFLGGWFPKTLGHLVSR